MVVNVDIHNRAGSPYKVPAVNRLARRILRPSFRVLFHILAEVRINGQANIPRKGAYLIAMNHVSIFDPPFVIAFWPNCPEAIGAAEIWSKPGQAGLARWYGGIPVRRGQYDRQVIETMIAILESQRPLVIAPEGGRSHTPGMRRGLPGVAFAVECMHLRGVQLPVFPVGITGTTDDFFQRAKRGERPLLEMNIGEAIYLPPIEGRGESRRAARQANVDQVMVKIAELLPETYRGVYLES